MVEEGWFCNFDGSDMKEVGYYNIRGSIASPTSSNAPWIINAKWTPDGKRISFVYKDRLMTVPVD